MIEIPYHYVARPYQQPFWDAMDSGLKRAILVWHRRTGKDKTAFNYMVEKAWERVGTYYYFYPTYAQGKKAIWDGMDREGFPFLHHIPLEIRAGTNETEMQIKLKNGSIVQLVGTDNIDSIMSTNPIGCVFSEYALQDPRAWEFVRPILRENGGWAIFLFTPRGRNFAKRLYDHNLKNPDWFCQLLTVKDTGMEWAAEADRKDGMPESLIQQEYYCSFLGDTEDKYYAQYIARAEKEGRITDVPYDPRFGVETWWDIGIGDATAIWFVQSDPFTGSLRVIDYVETRNEALPYFAAEIRSRKWPYDVHVFPHDAGHRNPETGTRYADAAESLGLTPAQIAPKLKVQEGIDAVRRMLPRMYFDRTKCRRGLDALEAYKKAPVRGVDVEDSSTVEYSNTPVHDWSSHGADALRTGAIGRVESLGKSPEIVVEGADFDVYGGSDNASRSWRAL
jgi:phage terminase large subunit